MKRLAAGAAAIAIAAGASADEELDRGLHAYANALLAHHADAHAAARSALATETARLRSAIGIELGDTGEISDAGFQAMLFALVRLDLSHWSDRRALAETSDWDDEALSLWRGYSTADLRRGLAAADPPPADPYAPGVPDPLGRYDEMTHDPSAHPGPPEPHPDPAVVAAGDEAARSVEVGPARRAAHTLPVRGNVTREDAEDAAHRAATQLYAAIAEAPARWGVTGDPRRLACLFEGRPRAAAGNACVARPATRRSSHPRRWLAAFKRERALACPIDPGAKPAPAAEPALEPRCGERPRADTPNATPRGFRRRTQ